MATAMSLDEILVLLHKIRRELDMTGRRLDIAAVDLAAHMAKNTQAKKRATKRKPRSGS